MVRIIVDSSCDLTPADCKSKNIQVIPLSVTLEDGTVFQDDGSIEAEHFYAHLKTCKKLPTTSQPSPELFAQAYEQAKEAGDDVVVITLSSGLSGTHQSACIAAEIADYAEHIYLVDSKTVSLALGGLTLHAATLRDQGLSAEEIANELERLKNHIHLFAMVNDLNNLRKGGRLHAAAAIAGGMLGVKPILTVRDGKVSLVGKARGLPGAYVALFKHMEDFGGASHHLAFYAAYTDRLQQLEPIQRYLEQNNYPKPMTSRIGPVIGTHIGAGAFGIAYFDNDADILP